MIHQRLSFITHETLGLEIRLTLMSLFDLPAFITDAKHEDAQTAEVDFWDFFCNLFHDNLLQAVALN